MKWFSTAREAVSCLKTDSVSFTDLSKKLLHRQIDSNLDEVIETLFKAISTLDAAAKLQDSQVCNAHLSWNLRRPQEIMCDFFSVLFCRYQVFFQYFLVILT